MYEESLKEIRLFHLKIKQFRNDLIVIFHYQKVTENIKSNLSVRCSERKRQLVLKLLHEKFQQGIRKLEQFVQRNCESTICEDSYNWTKLCPKLPALALTLSPIFKGRRTRCRKDLPQNLELDLPKNLCMVESN